MSVAGAAASPFQASRVEDTTWLLALCPLLAVSDTVASASGLGIATLCIVPLASASMMLVRRGLGEPAALAAGVLLLAGLCACAELLMHAWRPALREALGVFLPLLATNLVVLDHVQRASAAGGRGAGLVVLRRSVRLAGGIALILLMLALPRELIGRGSLLHDAGRMLGGWAQALSIEVFRVESGFLLAMLPPGAFIALGLLLAARNWLAAARPSRTDTTP